MIKTHALVFNENTTLAILSKANPRKSFRTSTLPPCLASMISSMLRVQLLSGYSGEDKIFGRLNNLQVIHR